MLSDSQLVQSPLFSADHRYLEEILAESESKLKALSSTAESYRRTLPALATHIADALHHVESALAVLENPQAYTVEE